MRLREEGKDEKVKEGEKDRRDTREGRMEKKERRIERWMNFFIAG